MPKRTDIKSILIIGAGPIVIGQACEFDYSGTQACKALKAEGYRIILVNSNPATIMTDPDLADATYIEPITPESSPRSSSASAPTPCSRPWAGRPRSTPRCRSTATACSNEFGVEMIGAKAHVIDKAEDRDLFRNAMQRSASTCPGRDWPMRPRSKPTTGRSMIKLLEDIATPIPRTASVRRGLTEVNARGAKASTTARSAIATRP